MPELILVITEFYTLNTGDTDFFAYHVLWFSPMTYFMHTLISCTHTEDARGRFVPERKTRAYFIAQPFLWKHTSNDRNGWNSIIEFPKGFCFLKESQIA